MSSPVDSSDSCSLRCCMCLRINSARLHPSSRSPMECTTWQVQVILLPSCQVVVSRHLLTPQTADSVYEIELHDEVDADLVSSSLVAIPPSPTPAPAPRAGPSKKKKRPVPHYSADVIHAMWQTFIRPGPYKLPQALRAGARGDAAAVPSRDVDVQPVEALVALDSDVEMSEAYDSPMDVSDVEMTKPVLFSPPRQVQRRPKHLAFCERLPGQQSTANLRRFSPTSLLPMREKARRKHGLAAHAAHATLGSRLFCVKLRVKQSRQPSTCIGQAVMGVIIERRKRQIHRRDLVKEYNARTKDGQWRGMVGAWDGAQYVRSIIDGLWWRRTWQLPVPTVSERGEIATVGPRQLQGSDPADPAGERSTTNDDYDLPEDLAEAEAVAVAIDASVHSPAPVSIPAAHVDPQRVGGIDQTRAHVALARPVRPQTRRITPGREELRRLRAEAAWQRHIAEEREVEEAEHAMEDQRREERERREEEERDRREEEERERETRQRARMVVADRILDHLEQDRLARSARNSNAVSADARAAARSEHRPIATERNPRQVVAPVRSRSPSAIAGPSASRERSISPAPTDRSGPPDYDSEPDLPVLMPYPVRLGAPPRRRPDPPVLLPEYIDNVYRYSRRSPSPPPPYNAHTDRQTLVAPVFIDEDEDNDDQRVLDRLPVVAEPIIVGAFPGAHAAPALRQEPAYRNGFDAALDIEEGVAGDDEEQVEGLFGDEGAGEAEAAPVLGAIGGWLGRVWRW